MINKRLIYRVRVFIGHSSVIIIRFTGGFIRTAAGASKPSNTRWGGGEIFVANLPPKTPPSSSGPSDKLNFHCRTKSSRRESLDAAEDNADTLSPGYITRTVIIINGEYRHETDIFFFRILAVVQ